MFKVGKRTKGKLKADVGIKDFYTEYEREASIKSRSTVDYKLYTEILKAFVKKLCARILHNSSSYKMPYRLGVLGIIKFEQNFDPTKKHKWAIDWKASKENNQIVYFENSDRYKWRWDKSYSRYKGKKYYAFKATKENNRFIKQAILKNPKLDYYSKLVP